MFPPKSKKGFLGRQEFQMKGWISRAANKLVSPSLFPVSGPSRQLDFSCNTPTFKALQVTLTKESNTPTFKAFQVTLTKESNTLNCKALYHPQNKTPPLSKPYKLHYSKNQTTLFSKLLKSALIVQGVFPKMEGYVKIVPTH